MTRSTTGRAVAAAVALLALTAGCGGPAEYGIDERSITAEPGDRFTLTVDENPSTGERWYLVTPKPDASVVRSRGDDYHADDDTGSLVGSGGRRVFTFEATGAGRTRIVLLHCPVYACDGDRASPAPATTAPVSRPAAERTTYTVTVK
ncbi:protease inhibitor I42 family protein [Streptomyces sp. KR55]|uniref:protease inhibitor I42 family protein n=1 Tax=Streptomyces sp. KR55 TaxID=3457425 RepID=UPI003FD15BD5